MWEVVLLSLWGEECGESLDGDCEKSACGSSG